MTAPSEAGSVKVLVAWDGSPAAATAIPVALAVAEQLEAPVEVLHVAEHEVDEGAVRRTLGMETSDARRLKLRIRTGAAATGILTATEEEGVALVVLTTHGRAIEAGRRLGRVAEEVAARTRRPVLLVRPEAETHPAALKRLLLPLDGTPTTATALRPATDFAARAGASIDLLYVAAPGLPSPSERGSIGAPRYVDQPQHEWPQWASEVIQRLAACCAACPPEVPVRMFLAQGVVGEEIARFALEHASDAIVLVRRSRLQPGRAVVLRAVFDLTPCPILLVGGPNG